VKKVVWLKPTKGSVSIGRNLIADNLRKRGFDVEVFECSGLAVFRIFLKLLKRDFDVIIGTTHLGLAVGGVIKIIKRKPFIADFVDKYDVLFVDLGVMKKILGYIVVMLQKFSLRVADAVIAIPEDIYRELILKRPNVFKTNLCVNLQRFLIVDETVIENAKTVLKNAGVVLNKPVVVYVGGFGRVYNLELLFRAMKLLPDFQLILIGGGPLESSLKSLKRSMNLNNVFFLGYQPNELIPGILKLCDVGVTLAEVPRQLKIYEYLASGLSVVVPESIMDDKDFEFGEYCIPTELNAEKVAMKIKVANSRKINAKKDRVLRDKLEKYDCKIVNLLYSMVLSRVVNRRG